jgi:hypothetical protein
MPRATSMLPGMRNLAPDAQKLGLTPVKPSFAVLKRICHLQVNSGNEWFSSCFLLFWGVHSM